MTDILNIAYCINKKMIEPACVSIYSILKNERNINFRIWIFSNEIDVMFKKMMESVSINFDNVDMVFVEVDISMFARVQGLHGEIIPFAKILIPQIMDNHCDQYLFLDADTMVMGGLKELVDMSLGESYVLGAVSHESVGNSYCRKFYMANNIEVGRLVFNTGVMLVNTKNWIRGDCSRKLMNFIFDNHHNYDGADQVPINVVLKDKIYPMKIKFNKRASPDAALSPEQVREGIVHFVGIPKPWDICGRWLNKNSWIYNNFRRELVLPKRSVVRLVREMGIKKTLKGLKKGLGNIF